MGDVVNQKRDLPMVIPFLKLTYWCLVGNGWEWGNGGMGEWDDYR
jgi:hypothetical protein